MKYTLSAATLVLIMVLSAASGVALSNINSSSSSSNGTFSIESSEMLGVNEYTLLEVDEGDNDEEEVVTVRMHEFILKAMNADGVVTWDFDDGTTATGLMTTHAYAEPGHYTVTATSTTTESIIQTTIMLTVDMIGTVESDNMECVCAPTAKDTVIDLIPAQGIVSIEGFVTVEHDGSSESCTLRNPLQECHVRVFLERTLDGSVIGQEVLFDDTFRSNELSVPFDLVDLEFESGEGLQLRLETDQVRDWHKPSTEWSMTAPV
jgi:hypothetical protein